MVNSNIWRNIVPLRDTAPQNVSDLEFDLSKSIKAKCDGGIGLPIYDFWVVFNSNNMSISHCLAVLTAGNFTLISYN